MFISSKSSFVTDAFQSNISNEHVSFSQDFQPYVMASNGLIVSLLSFEAIKQNAITSHSYELAYKQATVFMLSGRCMLYFDTGVKRGMSSNFEAIVSVCLHVAS